MPSRLISQAAGLIPASKSLQSGRVSQPSSAKKPSLSASMRRARGACRRAGHWPQPHRADRSVIIVRAARAEVERPTGQRLLELRNAYAWIGLTQQGYRPRDMRSRIRRCRDGRRGITKSRRSRLSPGATTSGKKLPSQADGPRLLVVATSSKESTAPTPKVPDCPRADAAKRPLVAAREDHDDPCGFENLNIRLKFQVALIRLLWEAPGVVNHSGNIVRSQYAIRVQQPLKALGIRSARPRSRR